MNILVVGSGGREHTLLWKMAQSDLAGDLFAAPGNAGTTSVATNLPLKVTDFPGIADACLTNDIKLIVVGPEVPLDEGIVDYFKNDPDLKDIMIIGPGKEGAQLEASKDFAKRFMQRHNIPTAGYATFTKENYNEGLEYIKKHSLPVVLKADGLAAGKGVVIAEDHDTAVSTFKEMIQEEKFGSASNTVVIEQFLIGVELSVFVLTDGKSYVRFPEAKDYKRIGEGDSGPNTGGMGAISPVPFADKEFISKVEQRIIQPTVNGIRSEGMDYKGFIFFGLINVDGDPYVIEYNVRMGDPETQIVFPRTESDLVQLFVDTWNEDLEGKSVEFSKKEGCTLVLVSGGYPGSYEKGKVINGLVETSGSELFHAGTSAKDNTIVTSGGRVLAVTSLADNWEEAVKMSMKNAEIINWEGKYYRKDLGFDLSQKEKLQKQ